MPRNRSRLVAVLLIVAIAPAACDKAPGDPAIDTCVAAYDAAAKQTEAVYEARSRGEKPEMTVKAGEITRGCAATFAKFACRAAHEHFEDVAIEERAVTLLKACAVAYCAELSPRPVACDNGGDRRAVAENQILWDAIARHDLGSRADRLIAARKQAAERAGHAATHFDAGARRPTAPP